MIRRLRTRYLMGAEINCTHDPIVGAVPGVTAEPKAAAGRVVPKLL